ncbi:hypothetical protein CVT26_004094 [Gymnopilus dilepis]|uniref:Uncharacterized protein n=1 Tax=Gymnopilus dilepis TaxID=231916 RepID=A0A409WKU8_9AGAR|nr:hypothetical protein CVT26_004094 [Gymnopilus dilepis]
MDTEGTSQYPVERAIYVSSVLSGVLYGVLVYMVFQSYYLLKNCKKGTSLRSRTFYIFYGFIQLFLATAEICLNSLAGQLMLIDYRNSPEGPFAYYLSISGGWFGISVISCQVVSVAMADALLLYRCYIIWNKNIRVVIFPLLLYVAEFAMGITVPVALARSHASFLHSPSTKFSIPWVSLECSLTALLTLLIVGRILYVVHDMKTQGVHLHSDYTGVVSVLVEAAIPLSLSGMVFAVCIARNLAATVPFACIWGLLVAIAPQSIILRVALGRAWTANIAIQQTAMRFNFNKESLHGRTFYIFYGFVQLFFATVELSLNSLVGQMMWIDYRDAPGGPFAYYLSSSGSWFGISIIACEVVAVGMADGLLLYRCYIIWGANIRVVLFPLLLYIAELVKVAEMRCHKMTSSMDLHVADMTSYPIEYSIYVSNILSGILYGVLVYMVFQSTHLLRIFYKESFRNRTFYIFYGFMQLFLATVEVSLNSLVGLLMWIDYRDAPGGPIAYYLSSSSKWFGISEIACDVVSVGMADGLLVSQISTLVLIGSQSRLLYDTPDPAVSMLYHLEFQYTHRDIASLAVYLSACYWLQVTGVATVVAIARSHVTFLDPPSTRFSRPSVILECSVTVLSTLLIVGRIFYVSHNLRSQGLRFNTNFSGVVAILVEAAIPLSISGLVTAVCIARNSAATVLFAHIWRMLAHCIPGVRPVMSMFKHLILTLFAISLYIIYNIFTAICQLFLALLDCPTALPFVVPIIHYLFPRMRFVLPVLQRVYLSYRTAILICFRAFTFFHRVMLAAAVYCFSLLQQRHIMDCLLLGLKSALLVYARRRFGAASNHSIVSRVLGRRLAGSSQQIRIRA